MWTNLTITENKNNPQLNTKNLRFFPKLSNPLIILVKRYFILPSSQTHAIFNIHLQPFPVLRGHKISRYNSSLSTHLFFKPEKIVITNSSYLFCLEKDHTLIILWLWRDMDCEHTWNLVWVLYQVYQLLPLRALPCCSGATHLHTYSKGIS